MEKVLPLGTFWHVLSAVIGLSGFKILDVALKICCRKVRTGAAGANQDIEGEVGVGWEVDRVEHNTSRVALERLNVEAVLQST